MLIKSVCAINDERVLWCR